MLLLKKPGVAGTTSLFCPNFQIRFHVLLAGRACSMLDLTSCTRCGIHLARVVRKLVMHCCLVLCVSQVLVSTKSQCYSCHQGYFVLDPRLCEAEVPGEVHRVHYLRVDAEFADLDENSWQVVEEQGIPAWRDAMLRRGDRVVVTRPFGSGNLEVCTGCEGVVTGFTLLLRSGICHIIRGRAEEQLALGSWRRQCGGVQKDQAGRFCLGGG